MDKGLISKSFLLGDWSKTLETQMGNESQAITKSILIEDVREGIAFP